MLYCVTPYKMMVHRTGARDNIIKIAPQKIN